jgi:hypothetical protein
MLSQIPASQLWEWIAYSKIEPFDERRADLRSAIIAKTIADINRGKYKPPYKIEIFMPKYERRRQTWQEQLKIVEALNAAFGGRDERDKRQH